MKVQSVSELSGATIGQLSTVQAKNNRQEPDRSLSHNQHCV